MTTDQTSQPLDLAAIRARADEARSAVEQTRFAGPADLVAHGLKAAASAADVPALLDALAAAHAEIERLYELRRAAIAWRQWIASKPVVTLYAGARENALIAAVDKLTEEIAR